MPQVDVKTQIIDRDELQRFLPAKAYRLLKFFENLGSDVSEALPNAIAAAVNGPNGATDNHVAVFDGPTGLQIKDGGIAIGDLAPLDSPDFTGIPTAPTAAPGTSSNQIATTAFVDGELSDAVQGPSSSANNAIALFDGTTGKLIKDSGVAITSVGDVSGPGASVNGRVATFNGTTGKVIQDGGILLSALAPLSSPALTGNPTAPTQAVTDNDTSIATTAFVQSLVGDAWTSSTFAPTASSGAFTSATCTLRYKKIGKTVFFNLVVTIVTNGTAAGSILVALPWNAQAESSFAGRESQTTGTLCGATVLSGSSTMSIFTYNNLYPGGSNYRIAINGVMESQ